MDVQVDYAILIETMQEKLASQLNQIIALESRIKAYDKALTEALNNASENKQQASRKKSVNTDKDADSF